MLIWAELAAYKLYDLGGRTSLLGAVEPHLWMGIKWLWLWATVGGREQCALIPSECAGSAGNSGQGFQPFSFHGTHKPITKILQHTKKYVFADLTRKKIGLILIHSYQIAVVVLAAVILFI